jgi:deoxycytidylate deaminase
MNYQYLVKRSRHLRHLCVGKSAHITWILDKRTPLGLGLNNMEKTHPKCRKYHYQFDFIHSELSAIINFVKPNYYLRRCTLVNLRFWKSGRLVLAKPCSCCQNLLRQFGIQEVWYSTNEGTLVKL